MGWIAWTFVGIFLLLVICFFVYRALAGTNKYNEYIKDIRWYIKVRDNLEKVRGIMEEIEKRGGTVPENDIVEFDETAKKLRARKYRGV